MAKGLFLVTTKVIIRNNFDDILLIKRGNADSFPHTWDLPGGLLESGDTPYEAISREALEETNISLTDAKLFGVTRFIRIETPTIALFFQAKAPVDCIVKLSEEHTEFAWIKVKEILNFEMQPWISEFLKQNISLL